MYLATEEYSPENTQFLSSNDIQIFKFSIKGNKEPFETISNKDITDALNLLLDTSNHPILVHCNKGKHRVGCLVGCLRRLEGWSNASIYDEYKRFTGEKPRLADQDFIQQFPIEQIRFNQVDPVS